MGDITIWMAFVAGLISFISPCVLPLVPGYLSYVSGVSVSQIKQSPDSESLDRKGRWRIFIGSIFFVIGFSTVFILLGATATSIGALVSTKIGFLAKVAGVFIILFGIYKLGLIPSLFLARERRFFIRFEKGGPIGAVLLGACFAFGWTPCIGPILGSILTYAGTLESSTEGIKLLSVYSLGLAVPFLAVGLGIDRFVIIFDWFKHHAVLTDRITGIIMIILGIMIFTDSLVLIPRYLTFFGRFSL